MIAGLGFETGQKGIDRLGLGCGLFGGSGIRWVLSRLM